jgi:hypothetical protein
MLSPQRRDSLRFGLWIGTLVAGGNFLLRILPRLLGGSVTISIALAGTVATFIMFGGLAFGLAAGGGYEMPDGKIGVRGWFAWLFLGAIVSFVVGALAGGTEDGRWGVVAAAGWITAILVGRALVLHRSRRGA